MASQLQDERVRVVSKVLFGSSARLQVAAYLAQHEKVFARQTARELGIAENEAGRELRHFTDAGLLKPPSQRPRGRQRQMYRRKDSSFWPLAQRLLEEVHKRRQ